MASSSLVPPSCHSVNCSAMSLTHACFNDGVSHPQSQTVSQYTLKIFLYVSDDGVVICILQLRNGCVGDLSTGLKTVKVEQLAISIVNDLVTRGQSVTDQAEHGCSKDSEQGGER